MRLGKFAFVVLLLVGLFLPASSRMEAQVNTVNLSGTVLDPQQLAVKDAKITLRNTANGAEREQSAIQTAITRLSESLPEHIR